MVAKILCRIAACGLIWAAVLLAGTLPLVTVAQERVRDAVTGIELRDRVYVVWAVNTPCSALCGPLLGQPACFFLRLLFLLAVPFGMLFDFTAVVFKQGELALKVVLIKQRLTVEAAIRRNVGQVDRLTRA